mgnify:CR=1 FL=1
MKFDFEGVKARDMIPYGQAVQASDFETMAVILAERVVECPAEWGDPKNPDTYLDGSFEDVTKPAFTALAEWYPKLTGVKAEFDTRKVTGRQMFKLNKAGTVDVEFWAGVLATTTVKVLYDGKAWIKGDLSKPETYLGLDYGVFRWLLNELVDDIRGEG